MLQSIFKYLSLFFLTSSMVVIAQEPHGHQGKLKTYSGEPPEIVIDENELALLASGQAIFKKVKLENTKRGIAIFRVNTDAKTIWSVIKDFKSYPQWIEDITATKIYQQDAGNISVKFTAGNGLLGDTSWYAVHDYPEDDLKDNVEKGRNWGTWKLDYEHQSDLDDSVGFWRVLPVVGEPEKSDVIYSADLKLKGLFVSLFETSLIDSSLKDATQWVKIQAESLQ